MHDLITITSREGFASHAIPRALVTYMASQSEISEKRNGPDELAEPGLQVVTPGETKGPTPDAGKGGQGRQERHRRARSDELTLTSADSTGGARDGGAYDSAANRFRSNVEIVEKPRQMVVLLVTIAGASYLVRKLSCFFKFFIVLGESKRTYCF